jgi:putative ABC transport system permease protein
VQLLVSSASQAIPRIGEAGINIPVLLFTLALSLGTGVLFGLAPALRSSSVSLSEAFKDGSRGSTVGLSRDRLRSGAAVAQVGLALVLVVGAGLLIRSVMLLQQVDPGFDPSGVLVGRVALPEAHFSNPASARLAFWRLAEDLNALPGVQAAAVASTAPFGGGGSNGLVPEGKALDPRSAIDSMFRLVSPRYFAAMRVPLRRGRVFDGREEFTSPKVMVINETLARRAWPGQDPIGTRFACCEGGPDGGPVWHEVIGVVGDVHAWGIGQDVRAEFYLPLAQAPNDSWNWMQRSMEIVVRSTSQDAVLTSQMRQVVAGVAPGVPLYRVGTMQHRISQSLDQSRFNTFLMSIFAGLALFLAALGIYGVMAYSVTQRNHEIGIRIALGARSWDVLRLIVGQGLWLVLAGIGIGLGGALALTHVLQGMLFGVTSTDPWTFAGASLLLGAVALAACYLPARRATKVDPMVALRYE